jgi:hypothetical protein
VLNAAQTKYGVSQELHSKYREEVLQTLSDSHRKVSAIGIGEKWDAPDLESDPTEKSHPAAEQQDSILLTTDLNLVREELAEESRQRLDEVKIQVAGLEGKLDAILAAV